MRLSIPAGALPATTTVVVQEITNTAPGGVGSAYRLRPDGTTFTLPATLTLRPAGWLGSLDDLTIAYQDDSGYWSRIAGVVRDPVEGTLTATTRHFSDWSIVAQPTARDLSGTFTISSSIGVAATLVVDGQATLTFAGENTAESFYLLGGTQSPRLPVVVGGTTCGTTTPYLETTTNVAELMKNPAELRWGTSGHWSLICADATTLPLDYAFDTIGMVRPGCQRGWVGTPTSGPDLVIGTYYVDCGVLGRMDATWRFVGSSCGASCQPAEPCRVGTLDCSTGVAVCVPGGAAANGTVCGSQSTCHLGACVASRTVQGTRLVTYWPDAGAPLAPAPAPDVTSLPLATVAALVPDAAGGFVTYLGTVAATGGVSIPAVPSGSYVLAFTSGAGALTFLETAADSVDLGYDLLGRPDATPAQASTPITVSLTGASPWTASDELQLTSSNADVFDVPSRGAAIAAGATAVDLAVDWSASALGGPMSLLAAADLLWVHDVATLTTTQPGGATAYPYLAASAAGSASGLTLASGTAAAVNVALSPTTGVGYVTGDAATPLDWRLTRYEAQLGALTGLSAMPAGAVHTLAVGATAHSVANPSPLAAGAPTLLRLQLDAGTGDFTTSAGLAYGRFLDPSLWVEWRAVELAIPVELLLAPATVPLTVHASVGHREAASQVSATALVPQVLPVQAPTINGLGAFGALAATTTTPTLSWAPPPAPSIVPTSYVVEVFALAVSGSTTTASPVASWRVSSTSIKIPANVLEAGRTYFARITAAASTPDPLARKPLSGEVTRAWATTVTGAFSP